MNIILDSTINSLNLLLAIIIPNVHIPLSLLNDIIYLIIRKLPCCLSLSSSDNIWALSILLRTTCLKLWYGVFNDLVIVLNEIIVCVSLLRVSLRHSRVDSLMILSDAIKSPNYSLFRATFALNSILYVTI